MIRFGPAGNSASFYGQGYKSSVQMPAWLADMGLNAYEYQCGKGVRIREGLASQIGEEARRNGIFLSIHAPYYINMASDDAAKRDSSEGHILKTLQAAKWMGAGRIVIHTGYCHGISREKALHDAMDLFRKVIRDADEAGFGDIALCPEVLGKHNQLGSLDEILSMCRLDDRLIPTVDFGHLYARSLGALRTTEGFKAVLNEIEDALGYDRLRIIHSHFSRIEFTGGGEKRHRTLDETEYGPDFEPLAEALYAKRAEPVVICESREYMAEDALKLKHIYEKVSGGVQ